MLKIWTNNGEEYRLLKLIFIYVYVKFTQKGYNTMNLFLLTWLLRNSHKIIIG